MNHKDIDRKLAITSASVRNEYFRGIQKVTCLVRCVDLRFKNLFTQRQNFYELKDFSLDSLAMQPDCVRKDLPNKFYTCQSK